MGVYFSVKAFWEVLSLAPEIDEIRVVLSFVNCVGQDKVVLGEMRICSIISMPVDLSL